jgi:hypothetical protein
MRSTFSGGGVHGPTRKEASSSRIQEGLGKGGGGTGYREARLHGGGGVCRRTEVKREARCTGWRHCHHLRYASWGMDHRLKLRLI